MASGAAYGVEWAEWNFSSDFDGNDEIFAESSSDSGSLMRLSAGTSAFSISGGILTCTETGPNDYLRIDVDDLQANGGGSYVNEYTLILDIRIDDPDWLPLYNTGSDNYNEAELWVRDDGAVGYGGVYTSAGVVPQSTWTRLVVTRYLDGGMWYRKIYADGILEASGRDGEGTDGNLSLYTNSHEDDGQFTILSDSDSTVYGACKLGNFGFVSEAMSDANIAALGGYDANGIGIGAGPEPEPNLAEVKAGPYLHFTKKAEVTIYWKTETAVASVLQYGAEPNLDQTVEDLTPKTDHELTVTGLKPETNYSYRIDVNGLPTDTYEFYSAFDFGPEPFPGGASPYPPDSLTSLYEQAAEYIINTSGINKGVCIDYGCGQGRLAYEIAKRSNLKIIGFEEDANKVAEARNYLDEAGIYGVQVTVLTGSLSGLNCRDYSANLVVSDSIITEGVCPGSSAEMFRVLAPAGGAAYVGQPPSCPNSLSQPALASWLGGLSYNITNDSNGLWAEVTRGAVADAGEWTHFYADLANTANSGETNLHNSMKVLWYGQPGPRYITDRHNRPMPSLYKDGLIVTPGIHRLMAFDAYNGSRYWDVAIPEVTRVVVLKDCGWVALASDYAYVAHKQNCVGLDLGTGEPSIHLQAPQLISGEKRNWGYLALEDGRVYGSGQKEDASLIGHSLAAINYAYYDSKPIATSDYLFCLDRHTGSTSWTYERSGGSVIINPAIVVAGDYICFIESRNTDAINDPDGRVQASVLMSGSSEYLVKLNKTTGAEVMAEPIDLPFEHVVYLSYAADVNLVIATGSSNDPGCRYEQYAYNLSDLSLAWNSDYYQGTTGGGHGEQDQHPVIVGSTMYSRYYKVNLSNGSVTAFPLSRGNCGTQSACATHLLGRNGNPYMYELPVGTPVQMTNETRPGCWINMIPAGGLLLIPESSAGCTCDYPIQTSMVFMPD
ncbi:MAG: methyltransferase domain-containing protein [Planctomycetota bacterium]|nr:MAG: methyltransferase domain-containing protein [Planctomycetota bacterium]